MNVACDFQLVCSFPCIMLMQSFVLLLSFGVEGILNSWKLNIGDFQYSGKFPPDTILYVSLFYYFHLHLHSLYYISNPHVLALARGIFVKAGPQYFLTGMNVFSSC